jgi:hypothetical protein
MHILTPLLAAYATLFVGQCHQWLLLQLFAGGLRTATKANVT